MPTVPASPPPSQPSALHNYVTELGGKRVISKLLIANNGIAAVKAIRSIRRWCYETFGDEHTIEFVAMATPEDVAANAEYVRMADMWTSVPGGSNNRNFANVELICDLADRFACHAVWAGWGHASENPNLPARLSELGITFLGPNPKSMHALGDKIASTIIAQTAGVPTVSWSGKGLSVDYKAHDGVPEHIYNKACVISPEHAQQIAENCGYPLVVKASEGGGGKGIRVVHDETAIRAAYRQVANEVPASPIFLMRLVQDARHLEVQIVADEYGDAIALYGRDCSVQRRHQKIIEEGPVVAAPPHVWKRLEGAAIALAKEVGYVGAGTVEYLYKGDKSGGQFYFLELNPRLQVEHPVTEWITGVNLPALQVLIGMGIPLRKVSSIRKFLGLSDSHSQDDVKASPVTSVSSPTKQTTLSSARDIASSDLPESLAPSPVPPRGHVIACRVTAENPDEGFQPTSGAIQELTFRNNPNVWGYFSVGGSGGVHEFADSQIGHLFAWGETRESSRRSLVLALKELFIRGEIRTTVEYLAKLLEMPAFRENQITTSWLDSLIAEKIVAEKPPADLAVIIGAVCRAHVLFTERADLFTKCLERGQLPPLDRSLVEFPVELIYEDVKYCFRVTRADKSSFRIRLASDDPNVETQKSILAELRTLADGAKLIVVNGRSHVCYLREEPAGLRLSIDGKTCLFPKEYDPTHLMSSVNGKLVRYLVDSDDHVIVGQPYVELEVMKMYLTLSAPEAGRITIMSTEGTSIEIGELIATLELDDPSKVRRAEQYKGGLPEFSDPQAIRLKPHQQFHAADQNLRLLLCGFDGRHSSVSDFIDTMDDAKVCAGEMREALSCISGRIPSQMEKSVEAELQSMLRDLSESRNDFGRRTKIRGCFASPNRKDAKQRWVKQTEVISSAISRILTHCRDNPMASDLVKTATKYATGSVLGSSIASVLDEYLNIEKIFARRTGGAADALLALRDEKKNELSSIVEIAASHVCLREKNNVLIKFFEVLSRPALSAVLAEESVQTSEFKARLHQLSQLYAPEYSDIALRARIMLADLRRPHFHHRRTSVQQMLEKIVQSAPNRVDEEIRKMVCLGESILDVLVSFILPPEKSIVSPAVRSIATKVHLLRSYRAYEVRDLNVFCSHSPSPNTTLTANWRFRFLKREDNEPSIMPRNGLKKHLTPVARGIISCDSADNLAQAPGGASSLFDEIPFRDGRLAAFENWAAMELEFDSILEAYAKSCASPTTRDVNVLTVVLRWDSTAPPAVPGVDRHGSTGPESTKDDFDTSQDPFLTESLVSKSLSKFCKAKIRRKELAVKAGIKSVYFIVVPGPASESVTYPGFYTFRVRNDFEEDPIYRHIDLPMAFQLELSRLSNFSITRFGYPTRSIHVFFAQDKSTTRKKKAVDHLVSNMKPPVGDTVGKDHDDYIGKTKRRNESKKLSKTVKNSVREKPATDPSSDAKKRDNRVFRDVDARFFVRAVIRQADVFSSSSGGTVVSMPEAERTFIEALDAVEMANCDRRFRRTDFNHIFLNIVPSVQIDIEDVEAICRRMFQRYAARCWSLRVFGVEIKVPALVVTNDVPTSIIPLRFLLFNPTGHILRVESYVETVDPNTGDERLVTVSSDSPGSLHSSLVSEPYPIMDRIQRRRVVAQAMETTYVYDFLHIFSKQLRQIWRRYSEDRLLGGFHRHKIPTELIESKELVLSTPTVSGNLREAELVEMNRKPGLNDIGLVVWLCLIRTPEYPSGRQIIVIANDITYRSGSFGPEEDALFCAASKMAREGGIPRIYVAANSGARIGLADEVREKLQVQWIDPHMPSKGFKCLAIKDSDLADLAPSLKIGRKLENGMHEITDIIGAEHGLGVENLMGSGLIAGETARAYDETFTLTYVSSRSVGIGAYLVRLGQRVIQKKCAAPIILTGYSALNKVLGHHVYISNDQLGGTKIMYPNGIAHTVVDDDVQGVGAVLKWLSYVPKKWGEKLPIVESRDPVSRPILTCPSQNGQPYDPRYKIIAGEIDSASDKRRFLGGLFDKDSWEEYLGGWAKTVIVGRARLGGVPTGIVAVETRSVAAVTPADPASPDTRESVVTQAGQVWYPDSAAKTAQAIRDFDREDLPLFIMANWRGFSGGMRDMFDEILKPGSLIVDSLRCYRQPVFVYIPPGGELRGGAWVVLDTLINPEMIEMYADSMSRGGVLEPEGTVDVKYRRRHLIKTMHQLDPKLRDLDKELSGADGVGAILSNENKQSLQDAIYAREVEILPVYRSVATAFCDLHDTPGRLLAKGAIRRVVDWQDARSFFYWRLQRRLAEERVRQKVREADPTMSNDKITNLLRKWAAEFRMENGVSGHATENGNADFISEEKAVRASFEDDNSWVFHWLEVEEDLIQRRIEKIRTSRIAANVTQSCKESMEGFVDGVEAALRNCQTNAERAELVAAIQEKISLVNSARLPSLSSFGIFSKLGKLGWDRDNDSK